MNWSDEYWIKTYTRDSPDWNLLSFEEQGLFGLLCRKLNRAGQLELGRTGLDSIGAAIGHPTRNLRPFLEKLMEDGCVRLEADGKTLCVGNFVEAQNAKTSPKVRQAMWRDRQRPDEPNEVEPDVTGRNRALSDVTNRKEKSRIEKNRVDKETKELPVVLLASDRPSETNISELFPDEITTADTPQAKAVAGVWTHYLQKHGHKPTQKLTPATRRKIQARLNENLTPEELCRAIDGNLASQWHQDNGHIGLKWILEDGDRVRTFMAKAPRMETSPPTERAPYFAEMAVRLLSESTTQYDIPWLIGLNADLEGLRRMLGDEAGDAAWKLIRHQNASGQGAVSR